MRRRPKRMMARRAMSRLDIVEVRELLEAESSRTTKLWMAFIASGGMCYYRGLK